MAEVEALPAARPDPSRERVIVWTLLVLLVANGAALFITRLKVVEGERFLGRFLETFVFQATLAGFAIYLARSAPEGWRRRLLLVRPNLSGAAMVLLLLPSWGLVLCGGPLAALAEMVLGREPSSAGSYGAIFRDAEPGWWIAFALLVSAGPGVCEELLFRGYLQEGLLKRARPSIAMLVTMSFFAVGHLPVSRAVAVLPHAWWLGYLAYRTRSLVPSILSHALINLTPIVLRPLRLNSDVMTGLWLILAAVTLPMAMKRLGRVSPGAAPA